MKGLSPTTQKKSKLRFFFLTEQKFVQLRQKAETCYEIMNDLDTPTTYFSRLVLKCPEMGPTKFKTICKQICAEKLLKVFYDFVRPETI